MRRSLLCLIAAAALVPASAGAQSLAEPVDCAGAARPAQPGTEAWHVREAENAYCATQRNLDTKSNPLYLAANARRPPNRATTAMDPLREPTLHAGRRFRFDELTITGAAGKTYPAMLFRPCDASCAEMPAGLDRFTPPYPGVVIMHGGAANQEMYWWAAEGLAEAGYMVLTVNIGRTDNGHYQAVKDGLDWLNSPANPHRAELDAGRIGLAGHSAGGVAVSRLGQEDPRVDAIASWDRAQSSPLPADLALRTPAIFFTADYNCQQVPVCLPQPRETAPDPLGPGNKDEDFRRLRAAGIDTMKVALRAAVHLDWTEWPELNGSRYGAITTLYYTLAWFDRYVKGEKEAFRRLSAARFDDSADVHSISSGRFDPLTAANVPPAIGAQPTVDRLSFHFRSGYWLEGGKRACEDIRAGCPKRRAIKSLLRVGAVARSRRAAP
jgi:dienelactone hydrolase